MRPRTVGNGRLKARIPASFAAALHALQLHDADAARLRSLTDQQWRELLPIMDRARLTLPFAQLALSGLPRWVEDRLSQNLTDTAMHWEHVNAAYKDAAATLDAKGVPYLVLKGFTQAPDFVSRPELRRQGDIDFYVPGEHIPAAVRALQEIGYSSPCAEKIYRYADHVPTLMRFGEWKWSGNIYDPHVPPAIEVHFCLWNETVYCIAIREFEEFWHRRRTRRYGDLTYPALDRPDHLAYFAAHILRGIFSMDSPVHHIRELATFLDSSTCDDAFWRAWKQMYSPRLRQLQATACSIAVATFSCNVPDAVQAEMECLPEEIRRWIESCSCSIFEVLFRRTREGRLLQWLFAETRDARKAILWRALGPGIVAGPTTVASFHAHPTVDTKRNLLAGYAAYPAYICSRVWMNGWAVLRFLAKFLKVHVYLRRIPARSWVARILRAE